MSDKGYLLTWKSSDQLLKSVPALLEAAAQQCAGEVRKAIQRGAARTGRRYRVLGRKRKYRASASGQPPAVATGALVKGISHSRAYKIGLYRWACDVGTTAKSGGVSYPAVLEKGTHKAGRKKNVTIKKRPVWKKTFKAPETQRRMLDVWRKFGK